MQVPIIIEPLADNRVRATGNEPFHVSVEGTTEAEALARLRAVVEERLAETGAHIVSFDMPDKLVKPNPWKAGRGMFRDDPLFDAWQEEIRKYRQQREEDPDVW